MARRRDSAVQFDLTPGGPGDDGGPDAGSGGPTADGPGGTAPREPGWFERRVTTPLADRWRGMSRRARAGLVGGTALAVVCAGTGAAILDARTDAAHAEHMATMPGGVADLSDPLRTTWQVATDAGILAVLPDDVVVTREGRDVFAVDVATGQEQWRHELGPWPQCGSEQSGYVAWWHRPVDRVACLEGDAERTVVVLGADGEVLGRRDLGVVNGGNGRDWVPDAPEVVLGPEGSLAVLDRPLRESVPADDVARAADRIAERAADGSWELPTLRLEDALTAEVRGEVSARMPGPDDLRQCGQVEGPDGEPEIMVDVSVWADPVQAYLTVCQARVGLLGDGTRVDDYVIPAVGGGVAAVEIEDGEPRTELPHLEGVSFPGLVVSPEAVDATGAPHLVRRTEGGIGAYDDAGRHLWTADVDDVYGSSVRAGGVAVLHGEEAAMTAVDLESGEVRWRRDDLGTETPLGVVGEVTDGSLAVFAHQTDGSRDSTELLAIDLGDGGTRWSTAVDGHADVVSVRGRPVLHSRDQSSFWPDEDLQAMTSDDTLSGLTTDQ